ncbi:MAG: aldehyde dehydrogenase [Acidimicrobiia bacterium]
MELIRRGLLIGGKEVDAADGGQLDVTNPATGLVAARVAAAGEDDIDAAVAVAQDAFESGVWSQMPIWDRAKIVNRLADSIDAHIEELFRLETLNNGRPITETRAQVARLSGWYRYSAALLLADRTDTIPMPGGYHVYTARFPIGVVAILSSFNHPLMIGSKSLAPALATGNSVVLKPSEMTPLTSLVLGDLALESGIPPGVLNVVPGLGPVAGRRIAEHPGIGKVSFTGGTAAGREVATTAAARFAKVTIELGGKTPVIVFDDVDLDAATRGAAFGAFIAAGQTCICGSRMLVQRRIYELFVEGLVAIARAIRIGDPADPTTQLGPVISEKARDRVLSYIEIAQKEGARLVCGGAAPSDPGLAAGYFLEPTVLADVSNQMRCAREEIFGPVTVVIPFDDEDDAIEMANDSPFGLGSAVWTGNVGRAHRVAGRLTHGIVWINDHHRLDPAVPWGGVRNSGIGREGGWESFHDFTHLRSVTVRTDPRPIDWYGGDTVRLN